MARLSEHWSGGEYLQEGDHIVNVKSCKFITFNSGNRGIEFTVADHAGREMRPALSLLPQALWKVSQFAAACGLTEDEARNYDTDRLTCHQVLVGRSLWVRIQKKPSKKDGKMYGEIVKWWPYNLDEQEPAPQHIDEPLPSPDFPKPPLPCREPAPPSDDTVPEDDIPF